MLTGIQFPQGWCKDDAFTCRSNASCLWQNLRKKRTKGREMLKLSHKSGNSMQKWRKVQKEKQEKLLMHTKKSYAHILRGVLHSIETFRRTRYKYIAQKSHQMYMRKHFAQCAHVLFSRGTAQNKETFSNWTLRNESRNKTVPGK